MWVFLNFMREALGLFQMVRTESQGEPNLRAKSRSTSGNEARASLRPPTIALDMLFLLAFLAFLEMNPVSESVISHSPDLPTADKSAGKKPITPLALRPVKTGKDWLYTTPEGQRLNAVEVVARVRAKNKTPILVIETSTSIQTYLDARQQLSAKGLKDIGLAARRTEGEKR